MFEHWRWEVNSMKENNMESKLECFLDNSNGVNMFEIKKDRNKIYQKDD